MKDGIDPEWQELVFDPAQKGRFLGVGLIACVSVVATGCLLGFLTYRMIFWRRYYTRPLAENQYVVLIYNLLLADLQQAIAFLIYLVWVDRGRSQYYTAACYLQGWFIQTADPGSGLFILGIASHTAAVILRGRQLPYGVFCGCIIALWMFILMLGSIPVGMWGKNVFVVSEAGWCWLSPAHEDERLWGHYFWIFIAEFGTIVLYGLMTIYLRRRMQQSSAAMQTQQESLRRLNRVVIYMVIYPVVYVILSLPLAAGRMAVSRGVVPSKTYFAVAGSFMALSGAVDVIVYTITRRHLLLDSDGSIPTKPYSNQRNESRIPGTSISTIIAAGKGNKHKQGKFGSRFRTTESYQMDTIDSHGERDLSTDDIVSKMDREYDLMHQGVYQETTIEIVHEPAVGDRSEALMSATRKTKRNSGGL
ncbi:hypothetical protein UA08_03095 [Talaromyces atroroseus]|uniref:G protein-coupled receptor GPR1/2/3 C-terminal domain-containing protein n=1 Tax=Talaromyces atroroseus TaxID=1441469 RepID=A0A225AI50_TALAT|nr:hypothetical protein UA08_03095 [Talaromyces atroroseus]OKL61121.1 hypothetical protein UA08_03095 [Talaromyces atroroseus]